MIVIYVIILLIPVFIQYRSFPFYQFIIKDEPQVHRKKIKKKGVMSTRASRKKRKR